jgi:NitT/TauT family transport system ATP-binding protein
MTIPLPEPDAIDPPAQSGRAAPTLVFEGVAKTFPDGTRALAPTSLSVAPGEFVTIVGPSGCGKSTLLRVASGLERPSTGTVTVDRKDLGYVFQDATLLQWRTVRANVALFAELAKVPKAVREARVAEAIELVGLSGFETKYPKQLSGGMRMRASLARSLVMDPTMFLFDEPFGALDEITRDRLNLEIMRIWRQLSMTALFITHSIAEAVFLSTEVVVMAARPGRVTARIPIDLPQPRSAETREDPRYFEYVTQVRHELTAASAE